MERTHQVRLGALWAAVVLLAFAPWAGAQGRALPVVDLNQNGGEDGVHYRFVPFGDVAYFVGSSIESGGEIWRTDGTEAGTTLFLDLRPGRDGSDPFCLTAIGDRLYFSADDGIDGRQAWVSDGTVAGTRRLIPDLAGNALASPCRFTESAGLVFFISGRRRVWRTDGTAEGTILLSDGGWIEEMVAFGDEVFFPRSGLGRGEELWASDGTVAGTRLVKDVRPGEASSFPSTLRAASGGVVFVANTGDWTEDEVWGTDGTESGTVPLFGSDNLCGQINSVGDEVYFPVVDGTGCTIVRTDGTLPGTHVVQALPSTFSFSVQNFHRFGDRLLFSAERHDLYSLDPATGALDHVMHSSECSSPFFRMTPFDGHLYFRALYERGRELHRTDGTPEGTGPLPPFPPRGTRERDGTEPIVLGDRILFSVRDAEHGLEPWVTDGTPSGTHLLRSINASTGPGVGRVRQVGETIFLEVGQPPPWKVSAGSASSLRGPLLWSTDGSAAGTRPVPWAAGFERATVVAGDGARTFFLGQVTYDQFGGWGLYVTDGTEVGIQRLADVGRRGPYEVWGRIVGPNLLFSHGSRTWVSDGTPGGTVEVPIEHPNSRAAELDGVLLLSSGNRTLQRTDGTAAGTWSLRPDLDVDDSSDVTRVGEFAYFHAFHGSDDVGLWRTDGTDAGTTLVRTLPLRTSPFNYFYDAVEWRGALYFTLRNAGQGFDLWRSDGTAEGTTRVAPISERATDSLPILIPAGHRLFFVGDDGVHGEELMVSDGTEGGTRMVADVLPGPDGSRPRGLVAIGADVYFVADDGVHGKELWFSDGTEEGTFLVDDIRPGRRGSHAGQFQHTPAGFLFTANDGLTGIELFTTTCGDGVLGEAEQCDLGAANGRAGSCCSASCRMVVDGADLAKSCAFDVDRVTLRRRPGRGSRADRVVVRALVGAGVPIDASDGIVLELRGSSDVLAAIHWDVTDCEERRRGWRCRLGGDAFLDLRRRSDGATALHARARGLTLPRELSGPFELAVGPPSKARIRSAVASCAVDARRLVCEP